MQEAPKISLIVDSDTTESMSKTNAENVKVLYKTITIVSDQENLTKLDPHLSQYIQPSDFFSIHDLTDELNTFVTSSGIRNGTLVVQIQHTSATLAINELNEPMFLMDLARKLNGLVPKEDRYLHNSPMRTVNVVGDNSYRDRNADAHLKASLCGHPSITLIVRNGELVLGQWQRVALIDFDGPRTRSVIAQILGF